MNTTTSADGTVLAFDRLGLGPPVVLVGGAFQTRSTTAPLAAADTIRSGQSGPTGPWRQR
jgi:hypothetical protein